MDTLWPRLHAILNAFGNKLAAADPTLSCDLGLTVNDAFIVRGYLALQRYTDGGEVAITVDVRGDDKQLTFESDACTDDGRIIADGPNTRFQRLKVDQTSKPRFATSLLTVWMSRGGLPPKRELRQERYCHKKYRLIVLLTCQRTFIK